MSFPAPDAASRWRNAPLNRLAAVFLSLYALALTLAPAVRARSWDVELRWSHWLGLLAWLAVFGLAHRLVQRHLVQPDTLLLPVAGLLTGWGLLSIFRLDAGFGLRQSAWLVVGGVIFAVGVRQPGLLGWLRRYKYLWLTGGLLLTGLTLVAGTSPSGFGPQLWLGGGGLYLQPSEPLKLLLIVYLAAYLADRLAVPAENPAASPAANWLAAILRLSGGWLPLLAPTLVMVGLALALLVVQRDLGTASILLFLFVSILYLSSGRLRLVFAGAGAVALAGLAGYWLYDLVRLRVEAWLNPWIDPSGRSFQIVQSLLAIANGGLLGRGPGMGNPALVPVALSDFIYAAILEESGLIGGLALLGLLAILAQRGMLSAVLNSDPFQRLLAAGLTAYLVGQSILIIGGNTRLLPLTGVTLPFVSYGGSSLVTSFIALLLLLKTSQQPVGKRAASPAGPAYLHLTSLLLAGLAGLALVSGWWAVVRAPALQTRTDDARRSISDRFVQRGALLDRAGEPLTVSQGEPGAYQRWYLYPPLGPVLGYTHPVYGQSGLEASLDAYLRGLEGNPGLLIWWNHLLYGQPPPGLAVRLSLDLSLQTQADAALGARNGALVLLNAANGEILAMASHPTFDPNNLDTLGDTLRADPEAPLFNRAVQGSYPPGGLLAPYLLGILTAEQPELLAQLPVGSSPAALGCSLTPAALDNWGALIQAGCLNAARQLARQADAAQSVTLANVYAAFGFDQAPSVQLPAALAETPAEASLAATLLSETPARVSPLQAALAAASLSNAGQRPAPRLVLAVNTSQSGWVVYSPAATGAPASISAALLPGAAHQVSASLAVPGEMYWQAVATAMDGDQRLTWYIAGTLPAWQGAPLALALLLEDASAEQAVAAGQQVLEAALAP